MVRSILLAALAALMMLTAGCSPEAAKDMASKAADDAAGAAKQAASDAGAGMSDMMSKATKALAGVEGGSDMLKKVTEMFGKATSALGGVKDADSATAALPELSQLTDGFGGMSEMLGKMPDAAKVAVAGVFKSSIEQLKPIIDKVMALPGVEAVLKPAIEAMMSKLEAFKV